MQRHEYLLVKFTLDLFWKCMEEWRFSGIFVAWGNDVLSITSPIDFVAFRVMFEIF